MRTVIVVLAVSIASLVGGVACRSLEGASQDVTNSFRGTQQDLQHGVRGEPDPNDPNAPAASGSARPSAPTAPPATTGSKPQPAPTNSGVSL